VLVLVAQRIRFHTGSQERRLVGFVLGLDLVAVVVYRTRPRSVISVQLGPSINGLPGLSLPFAKDDIIIC
jgi:hypothetical protein